MEKNWTSFLPVFLAVAIVTGVLTSFVSWRLVVVKEGNPESPMPVLERVTRSGSLKVGYLVLPPYVAKSANSETVTGIYVDIINKLAQKLGLKVQWVEEVNLANFSLGLDNGRYDLIAFPLWRSASRIKVVSFSTPLFYTPLGAYARKSDNRFNVSLDAINSSEVRVVGMDGELSTVIAREEYPKANTVDLPQMSDYSQLLLEVLSGKGDIVFFNRVLGDRFNRKNGMALKVLSSGQPIRIFAECFALPSNDLRFKEVIDVTLLEMIENGDLEKIFRSYDENFNEYYRPARPYMLPTNSP